MMRLAPCLLLLTVAAAAQSTSIRPLPIYRIGGRVVNSVTGQRLSKIEVSIGEAEGGSSWDATTGEDGLFTFEKLKQGKYWLRAQGHGFSTQGFEEHEEFWSAIAVGPDIDSEHLIFRLRPDATITGTITDEQSEPVVQAQVFLFRTGVESGAASTRMRAQTVTDDRGIYHFGHVMPGTYYIAVSANPWYAENHPRFQRSVGGLRDGAAGGGLPRPEQINPEFEVTYPVTYYPGVINPSSAAPVSVTPGDRLITDMALSATPALHVRVKDADFDPSKGLGGFLTQKLFGSITIGVPANLSAGGPGEFEISGISPGQFTLHLQTGNEAPETREEEIGVSEDSEVAASTFSAPASVNGTVQLDTGGLVSNPAFVELFNRSSDERFVAQISAKGEFQFSPHEVRPGQYQLIVGGVPEGLVESISAGGATIIGHQVDIGSGASVQLKIVLSHGVGRIDGTAFRDGKPSAGAMIVLVPQDTEHNSILIRRDQSDSDGTFTLYNVLAGRYTVVAIQNGWDLQWLNPAVLKPYLKGGEVVSIAAHERQKIKLNVQ